MNIKLPPGYRIIGYFLILSTLILFAGGSSMLFPDTFWKQLWFFKKKEYQELLLNRVWVGYGFWGLGIIMAFAAVGWFRRVRWGWWLAMGIFVVNGVSDGVRLVTGSYLESGIGVAVTACIIFYLTRPRVKKLFH